MAQPAYYVYIYIHIYIDGSTSHPNQSADPEAVQDVIARCAWLAIAQGHRLGSSWNILEVG